jgi:hypothetical protein
MMSLPNHCNTTWTNSVINSTEDILGINSFRGWLLPLSHIDLIFSIEYMLGIDADTHKNFKL